jgi:hypothetical protein
VKEDETDRECSTHGEKNNAYRVLMGELEGKEQLGRPRYGWEDNVNMDLVVWTAFVWLRLGSSG